MTRINGWDRALAGAVDRHASLPGEWGSSDCWMLTMDAIEAVTGSRILPHLQRYKTEAGGYRAFRKAGFETVEDALAASLQPVGRLSAQRGDVGVIERDGLISSGVFTADGFTVKTLYGEGAVITRATMSHFPITFVRSAFKVGRE